MTNTETDAPYGLSEDSWDNAHALALAAEIHCGAADARGLRRLVQYTEDMVRRLIMLMAAAMSVSARPKRGKPNRELQAVIAEVNALVRGHELKSKDRLAAPKAPPPPCFKWRKVERAARDAETDTSPHEDRPALTLTTPPNYVHRIDALMHAIAHPETYARKAAQWIADRAEPAARRKHSPDAERHWDNAFIQTMAQLFLQYGPEIWDSS